jgi:toxin ParE1/3/4
LRIVAYRLTRQAEDDLVRLYVNGTRDFGPSQAEAYFSGLETSFAFLADHPRVARERMEITPPVRIHPYRSHVIVYRIHGDDIQILRVRHGREDWDPSPTEG